MAARERKVIRGIVLRSVDTREADKILTVLTGEMGKLAVVAKGARGRRSRVTAATQLLAYSEMTVAESRGWQILSEASTIELFSGVRRDLERLSLASYFAELVDAVTASRARIAELEASKPPRCEDAPEAAEPGAKVCPICGAESDSKFCPQCGAPMGD